MASKRGTEDLEIELFYSRSRFGLHRLLKKRSPPSNLKMKPPRKRPRRQVVINIPAEPIDKWQSSTETENIPHFCITFNVCTGGRSQLASPCFCLSVRRICYTAIMKNVITSGPDSVFCSCNSLATLPQHTLNKTSKSNSALDN